MGATHRFLAINEEVNAPLDWFLRQPDPPEAHHSPDGYVLYFRSVGPLARLPNGSDIDVSRSPLVSLFPPVRKRGILWTTGEVHFLPTPLRRTCPALDALSQRFRKWLLGFELVFTRDRAWHGEWNYYLEGDIQDKDLSLYALPLAARALKEGQYFVDLSATENRLDVLCRALRHRGVYCTPDDESGAGLVRERSE
jgi:hypothetical protein